MRLVAAYADGIIQGVVNIKNGTLPSGSFVSARLALANLGVAHVDARGHFLLQNVPPGSYTLTVTALLSPPSRPRGQRPSTVSARQQIVVSEGQVSNVTIVLDLGQNPPPTLSP